MFGGYILSLIALSFSFQYFKLELSIEWLFFTVNDLSRKKGRPGEVWSYLFMIYTCLIYPSVSHLVIGYFSCHYFEEIDESFLRAGLS